MNGFSALVGVEERVFEVADDPMVDRLRITPKTVGSPVPEAGGLPPVVPLTLDFSRSKHPVRRVSDLQSRETVRQDRMTELHDDVPKPSTTALA